MRRVSPKLLIALLAVVAGLALIAAGCGGGGDDEPDATTFTGTSEEIYFATLSESAGAVVEMGRIIINPPDNADDTTSALEEQLDIYENAIDAMSGVTLTDEALETQRQELVTTAAPFADSVREVITATEDGTVSSVIALATERESLLNGVEALGRALEGSADAATGGNTAALEQLRTDLEPFIDQIEEDAGG